MLKIYVHVATFGTYQDVINNFYSRIAASGLYDKVDSINLMINGNIKDFNLDIMPKKYNVVHLLDNYDRLFEFSTLNALWLDCNKNPDMTVIYLHTKGISHLNSETIKDWVNYLAYFNINRWKDRINDLHKKNYDCSGTSLQGKHNYDIALNEAPMHYSGNFWWAKGSHITSLPDPYQYKDVFLAPYMSTRLNSEMWVTSNKNKKYFNAFTTGVNHYHDLFPTAIYES